MGSPRTGAAVDTLTDFENRSGARGERVRAMFGAITPRYDLLNTVLSVGLDRRWRRQVVALARLPRGGRAVDVCTGTGELARLLADAVGSEGRVVGLDFCPEMLEQARRKLAAESSRPGGRRGAHRLPRPEVGEAFPQLAFEAGDALRLPLEDGAFQAATMAFGLRNVESTRQALAEMRRVLEPGGRALVLELTRPRGLLSLLYFPYLFGILPLVGGIISNDFTAYRYLARSIAAFLPVDDVLGQMREVGLREVRAVPLCGGVATILTGVRPPGLTARSRDDSPSEGRGIA